AMRHLADLVVRLEEPLRTTLLLRYDEGLTAEAIARAQEVPAGTVRWRLKVALDRLREGLDERHEGERKRWRGLLAAPGAAFGRRMAASAAGAAQGALLMKKAAAIVDVRAARPARRARAARPARGIRAVPPARARAFTRAARAARPARTSRP